MAKDETGKVYGRLTVLSRDVGARKGHGAFWMCRCACGVVCRVRGDGLRTGHATSCGCAKTDGASARLMKHGEAGRDGGVGMTREYSTWRAMKFRCLNTQATGYKNYGGRGITVCARWRDSFANFLADMGRCPPGLTLDRIDNDGDYEPGNCRWTTRKQQATNRRQTRRYTVDGELISMWQIAEYLAMSRRTLYRLREQKD